MYILRTILTEGYGLHIKLCSDASEFADSDLPRLNYSNEDFGDVINVLPHTILFDHGIKDYHLEVISHPKYTRIFFKNSGGPVPFDLFGASFWLLSRYEEHLPFKGDQHNRFQYRSSLAYQYDFIRIPLVNLWAEEFVSLLKDKYPSLDLRKRDYNFISTIDIDSVFKFKFKGFVRTLAGILADLNPKKIRQRMRIILNLETDPYDCYDFLIKIHRRFGTNVIFFFLLGDYGLNDKNHASSDLRFQALIKHIADYSKVGIHPSFASNSSLRRLKVEVSRLANITHKNISISRQHFSMLRFPETYKNLLQAGLTSDYSMGYTNYNGFRASYCYPYKWYSLDIESRSSLTLHPFCITDTALLAQSAIHKSDPAGVAVQIIDQVKHYGGELVSIMHNDNFTEEIRSFYIEFLKSAGNFSDIHALK